MSLERLADIFERVRDLVARPNNDFAWSSWRDVDDALEEIDGILTALRAGQMTDRLTMSVLFAPTGPMQELALSSGWGNRFLQLAAEFDETMAQS